MEMFFGGEKRHEDLADVSAVIGNVDTWHHAADSPGTSSQPLMPPEALHRMKKMRAAAFVFFAFAFSFRWHAAITGPGVAASTFALIACGVWLNRSAE